MNIPNVIIAAFLLLLPASFAAPVLEYVAPTTLDDTRTANASVGINISVMEGNLSELNYEWNAANFTFYNDSLLFCNFIEKSTALLAKRVPSKDTMAVLNLESHVHFQPCKTRATSNKLFALGSL